MTFTLSSCTNTNKHESIKILESHKGYPKLATSFKELHKVDRNFITENYAHNFCEGQFDCLIDVGEFKNVHLIAKHENLCCLCVPVRESFDILINKEGKYLSDNMLIDNVEEINHQISKYLVSRNQDYNFIQILYDTSSSEEVLVGAIEQIGIGYKSYLKNQSDSKLTIDELKEEYPLKLTIFRSL
ncbi:hypothetical protein AVL50_06780 [Flammeovirga sp. SJP92]|nr:hypothetical protein AVL50_06780 [Flammeovirga sp. SJP92]